LDLRKLKSNVFVYGSFELLNRSHLDVFCYRQAHGQSQAIVVLNFSPKQIDWLVPESLCTLLTRQVPLLHNYTEAAETTKSKLHLRPFEALVWLGDEFKTHL
jgi:hypothetical protein